MNSRSFFEPILAGQKVAAVTIIQRQGLLLGVASPKTAMGIGFPGGKLNPHETPLEGALRELREETGVTATSFTPLLVRSAGTDGYTCYAFLARMISDIDDLRPSKEGVPVFLHAAAFAYGRWAIYNRRTFAVWRKRSHDEREVSPMIKSYRKLKGVEW